MREDSEKIYEELRELLRIASNNDLLSKFATDYMFQRTYLSAILNKQSQIINGREYVKKGSYYSNKEIIKCLKRFLSKENIK